MIDLTKIVAPFKKHLTYYNIIEYIIPSIAIGVLVYFNLLIFRSINLFEYIKSFSKITLIPISILFCLGWILYATRYYQLFPGYSGIKRKFRIKIADCFQENNKNNIEPYRIGKFIYRKYWELMDDKTRKESLKLHVNWVYLVHISNSIMLSFFLSVFLAIDNQLNGIFLSKYQIYFVISHVVIYFYFRRAARKNIVKSNFEIISNMMRDKDIVANSIPTDIDRYIDEID